VDAQQVACFELAWAAAELLAAECVLDAPARSETESGLALLFAADAHVSAASRLEGILLELGADLAPLRAAHGDEGALRMRREATSAAALSALGAAVAQADGDVGLLALDESHVLVQDSFRRFAREQVMPLAERIHRDDLTVPESLLQPLREMGVFGLSIPQRFGGTAPTDGEGALSIVLATEALSEASLGAAGSLITRPEILCRALLAGGTEAQKDAWLPRIATGNPLCAIAMTEPDHGSDVASVALHATRTNEGWRLNGAKTWCTFAGKAGLLMVVAHRRGCVAGLSGTEHPARREAIP
jgi:(2S)-methylsuccinyl-CoA dehydrogenase